jgi:hypothetical protein
MTRRGAFAGIVFIAALLGPAASDAAVRPAPLAAAAQAREALALLSQASGPPGLQRGSTFSELKFTNHDGFAIGVVALGQTVALTVSRKHRGGPGRGASSTTYLAHGKVTPTSIQASFADRGRISVRFRPTGRDMRATRDAGCRKSSGGLIGRLGFFVGQLHFRGEDGYTSADVHRVHGGSIDFAALIACLLGGARPGRHVQLPPAGPPLGLPAFGTAVRLRGPGPDVPGVRTHPSHGPRSTSLIADDKLPLSRTAFEAQLRGARARFLALDERSEGRIGVIRMVIASGPQSAFSFDDPLASAAVAPPAPFSGAGAFQRGPRSEKSWTGSLAVSFLGAPGVSLTGSPFKTQLVQSW